MAHSQTKEETRDMAQEAKNKAESVMGKAKQAVQQAGEKGMEFAENLGEKAKETASNIRERADAGAASVGGTLRSAAAGVEERLPHSGVFGSAASALHDTLENTGRYLEDKGVSGMGEDMTSMIRRYPIPSLLIGIGVGVLLGQFLTMRR